VLVDHVGKGTAGPKLGDHRALWASNRAVFLTKWRSDHIDVPRLASCDPAQFERNLEVARSVTGWMAMYFSGRANLLPAFARRRILRVARPLAAKGAAYVSRHRNEAWVRRLREWSRRDPRIDRLVRRLR
jgi:hypothetical protein